ncbi:MAG: lantibiotic dehydratase family protein [Bacteroidota bacterium]|nr:lantibiotic dehydratase family protein [Bacteroidota bacterium]
MPDKYPYRFFNTFLLRTPALPHDFISPWVNMEDIPALQVMELWEDEFVKEGVFLASPELYTQIEKWRNKHSNDPELTQKLARTLFRYLLRMSVRATPFGLFAGINAGNWSEHSSIKIFPVDQAKRHVRLDMHYLGQLIRDLENDPGIKHQLKYYPNSSMYIVADSIRYIESRYNKEQRTHHIVSVDNSKALGRILEKARSGKTLKELTQILLDDGCSKRTSGAFIMDIVNSQVLVSELEPALTASSPLQEIISTIEKTDTTEAKIEILKMVQGQLHDASGKNHSIDHYVRARKALGSLDTSINSKYLFQVDLEKSVQDCTLESRIKDELIDGIRVLKAFSIKADSPELREFRSKFMARYEMKEVPLLQALDPEIGIAYGIEANLADPAPLIDDLILPERDQLPGKIQWHPQYDLLLDKYYEAIHNDSMEIRIEEQDLQNFTIDFADLPDTFNICFRVLDPGIIAEHDPKLELLWASGPGAANIIGRFCHMHKDIYKLAMDITDQEADHHPDVILAEIIHLPEGRTGNILQRPVLRPYEIPYLSRASVPSAHQIPVDDLFISIRHEKILLRSKQHDKQVIPKLSSAHNYARNAIPVYRFLCDLQAQDIHDNLDFSWGFLESKYRYFPRVVYKNLVLSPAHWKLQKKQIRDLSEILINGNSPDKMAEWRQKLKIPEMVLLADFDNELLVNFNNRFSREMLGSLIKGRSAISLKEFLFDPASAMVKSKHGSYNHEIIAALHKTTLK